MTYKKMQLNRLRKFSQLAKLLPSNRLGRSVHPATLHRWRETGVRGVFLEATRTPNGWCTTPAAILRFFARLAAADQPADANQVVDLRPPRGQQRHQDDVERQLREEFKI